MMVSAIAILFAIVFFVVGITTAYKGKGAQTVTFAVSYVSSHPSLNVRVLTTHLEFWSPSYLRVCLPL